MNRPEIPTGWFLLTKGEKIIKGDMCSNGEPWAMCKGLLGQIIGDAYVGSYTCIRKDKAGPVPEKIWLNIWD